jgi:cytosine/adenosine deaminase-related metal-dependent hydrolase
MQRSTCLLLLGLGATACDVDVVDGSVPSKPLPVSTDVGGFGQGGSPDVGGGGGEVGGEAPSGGGGSGQGACDGGGPLIEKSGVNTKFLLKGTLLLPAGPLEGELLIEGEEITCAATSCSGEPGAAGATVIDTQGVISPGLLDAHNHIIYSVFDEDDWAPAEVYTNHSQWPGEARYGAMGDAKRYLNGEDSSPINVGCEMDKYAETKGLIAGTTSIQASPGSPERACYQSVARTVDTTHNDLPDDLMQTSVGMPSTSSADGVCANFADGDTNAYVIHIAEGVDQTANNEFQELFTKTTVDGCLFAPQTTIIHGVALTDAQIEQMAAEGMQLVWSPQSNVFLYGGNTDLTKTANIPKYIEEGINIAIAPDWSLGGSQNMLDEMRFGDHVDDEQWGNILAPADIWQMATINAAVALGVDTYLGSLEVGKRADIAVFLPAEGSADPYEAVLQATPREVTMVFLDGRLLYGDADLDGAIAANSIAEDIDICCRAKFLAIAETGGNPNDNLDQLFSEMTDVLNSSLEAYDALDLTEWNFAPVAPVVKCP